MSAFHPLRTFGVYTLAAPKCYAIAIGEIYDKLRSIP